MNIDKAEKVLDGLKSKIKIKEERILYDSATLRTETFPVVTDKDINTLETLLEDYRQLKLKLDKVEQIINNVLYFDDSSDYCGALWDSLKTIRPDMDVDYIELEYMED